MFKWCRTDGSKTLTKEDIDKARMFLIKLVQRGEISELEKSSSQNQDMKTTGRYKRLAPFVDDWGVWRIGLRLRDYTPFTMDKKAPAFVPYDSRFTLLLMEQAHREKHSGVEETVARFRMMGFWCVRAAKLAKKVKSKCVTCRILDKQLIHQAMGGIPSQQILSPMAWGEVEMDLFGPFLCRGEANKRTTIKVWGVVIVDRNSGAVHCDVVMDYGAQEVIKTLRRFAALRGWPVKIASDLGSQLVSSSGNLESWWSTMGNQLSELATSSNFEWEISPANSPWRQGRCESRIKSLKRLLTISASYTRLSPLELQTILYEAANLANERPIGLVKSPTADGSFKVITPNTLLLGRSLNKVPDDINLGVHLRHSDRYELIQQVTSEFWDRWCQEVTPAHVIRQKWHQTGRNLTCGDVVLIHDKSPVKGTYILGVVEAVNVGDDGLVRSCSVGYTVGSKKDSVEKYTGGRRIVVSRSVQRLTLVLPVEEQTRSLQVVNNDVIKATKVVED